MRKCYKWIKFEKSLPTGIIGKQVPILFGHPKWATYIRGMYTHFEGISLQERLSMYRQDIDRYVEWDSRLPTHYIILPDNPKD